MYIADKFSEAVYLLYIRIPPTHANFIAVTDVQCLIARGRVVMWADVRGQVSPAPPVA